MWNADAHTQEGFPATERPPTRFSLSASQEVAEQPPLPRSCRSGQTDETSSPNDDDDETSGSNDYDDATSSPNLPKELEKAPKQEEETDNKAKEGGLQTKPCPMSSDSQAAPTIRRATPPHRVSGSALEKSFKRCGTVTGFNVADDCVATILQV